MNVWDFHRIRPSHNPQVPHGRPNTMYCIPHLYGTRDMGHPVMEEYVEFCKEECVFRRSIPCEDLDIFDACVTLMAEFNWRYPDSVDDSTNLYLQFRRMIRA